MHQLSSLLENHRATMKEDIITLINAFSQSLKASMDALQGDMNSFNKRPTKTEVTEKTLSSIQRLKRQFL